MNLQHMRKMSNRDLRRLMHERYKDVRLDSIARQVRKMVYGILVNRKAL